MADRIHSVVIGDVNGRLVDVFAKLTSLHSKQSFAFAIVAGNLFSDPGSATEVERTQIEQLLDGSITVPLPTYFSLGTNSLPQNVIDKLQSGVGELCPNLTILGRRVSVKTMEGFRLMAIGGAHTSSGTIPEGDYSATFSDADTEALFKDSIEADILITSLWPAAVRTGSRASYTGNNPGEAQSLSDLCSSVTPRYHFSTSPAFYEREPFFHVGPSPRKITRFISLAPFGNAEKQKWIYAFSLEPQAPPPQHLEPGHTASPFRSLNKRKAEASQEEAYDNFRYANGHGAVRDQSDWGRRKKQRPLPPPLPSECFFCLSNEACETHMIASIGNDCYVAVAKGPLSTRDTFPGLGFPGHMLVIPLQHVATLSAIADEAKRSTLVELQRFRSAMHDMLKDKTKDENGRAKLGAVTWEISRSRGVHVHWQFLPVPVDMVQRGLVETAFDVEAENSTYPKFEKSASGMASAEEGDYIKVMIWSETLRKDMVLPVDGSFRFDIQFGRRVMAKLLGLEARMDWRACSQDKGEEEEDATKFKEAFKAFDFSLEE